MNRGLLGVRALYALGGGVIAALLFAPKACAPHADPVVIDKLVAKGFALPSKERPKIADLPRGVVPEAILTGRVDPIPHAPGVEWPVANDLGIECRCELVREGDLVLGRIIASAWLQDADNHELIRRGPEVVGHTELRLSKELERFAAKATLPRWEIRAGVGAPGLFARVGFSRYLTQRVGVWAEADAPLVQGGDVNVAAGLAIRF